MSNESWAEKLLKPIEVEVKVMQKDTGGLGKVEDQLLIPTPGVIRHWGENWLVGGIGFGMFKRRKV